MLFFARPEDQPRIAERLKYLTRVPFKFEFAGSQIIFFDPEEDFAEQDEARRRHLDTGSDVATTTSQKPVSLS